MRTLYIHVHPNRQAYAEMYAALNDDPEGAFDGNPVVHEVRTSEHCDPGTMYVVNLESFEEAYCTFERELGTNQPKEGE